MAGGGATHRRAGVEVAAAARAGGAGSSNRALFMAHESLTLSADPRACVDTTLAVLGDCRLHLLTLRASLDDPNAAAPPRAGATFVPPRRARRSSKNSPWVLQPLEMPEMSPLASLRSIALVGARASLFSLFWTGLTYTESAASHRVRHTLTCTCAGPFTPTAYVAVIEQ